MLQAGALSVEVTDARAGTPDEQAQFAEPGEADVEAWAASTLIALFDGGADVERALCDAAATLGLAPPLHETYGVEEQDWVRATQSQFGPIHVGERLHVVPSWCVPPPTGVTLRIDPGLAFGTGSHPTTRLCLEWLLEEIAGGESLLDYGCGSGVLAIAAAKLGAAPVFGVDVDSQALRASADNAEANGVVADFVAPDALPARTFEIVVANILANPLMLLAPVIAARVAPGGRIALCGILEAQAGMVREAYAQWFKLAPRRRADGWVLLAGRRHAPG